MCELLGFSSKFPARLTVSLETFVDSSGNRNPDGWGLAFYEGSDAYILREPRPACSSPFAHFVATHSIDSTLVLSHVRKATTGSVNLENTHPFARELGGAVHTFAFNGDVPGVFEALRSPRRFTPVGETDGEYAFCSLLDALDTAHGPTTLETRLDTLHEFGSTLAELGPANFLYCDSGTLFAFGSRRRHEHEENSPGLHYIQRHCSPDSSTDCGAGVTVAHGGRSLQSIVIVASVPLTEEAWAPVQEGELIALRHGEVVGQRSRPVSGGGGNERGKETAHTDVGRQGG